jgi:cysteinyl-tRNA synthetase
MPSFSSKRLMRSFTETKTCIMETLIKDDQLAYELQELYIISSHWNSDIAFVQDEVKFLNNALNRYTTYTKNLQTDRTAHFYTALETQEANAYMINNKITALLKVIEPFIIDAKREMGLDILERFNELEAEIKSIAECVKLIKSLVFAFIEDATKSGEYLETPVKKTAFVKIPKSLSYML